MVTKYISVTDANGNTMTHVYDDLYRLLSRSTPGLGNPGSHLNIRQMD
jgi:YD repeat-containing protein